jgi:hypothetical protein
MTAPWQPYREPIRTTALRTGILTVVAGVAITVLSRGRIAWQTAVLFALWVSLGGHFVELLFLNWLRPRLPNTRGMQIAGRLAVWFAGGVVLSFGMTLSARVLMGTRSARQATWWQGGLAFIGLELVVHLILHLRGRPSIHDGRG